ncbi:FtsW/RodA/SpoVE family cell cycle protein [Bacteroidota bacterium]
MIEKIRKYLKGDIIIWVVIFTLSLISILAVYSSTGTLAYKYRGGDTFYYFLKHGIFLIISLAVIFLTHLIHYKYYSRLSQLLLIISIPLLVFTLVLGVSYNQAARWITLPGLGFTIQSSDFAKLALIMYVARLLSLKQDKIHDFNSTFVPVIIPVIIVCGLIFPANFSTAAILFVTCMVLMFIGRIRFRFIVLLVVTCLFLSLGFIGIAKLAGYEGRIETWTNRLESYVNKDKSELDNFQVNQAKIAIVNGGLFGRGPGNSIQRNFLPHPYSDFIYAIIIEEYGFVGGVVVLFLYLYLLFRAGVIVRKVDRTFPAFVAIGLAVSLVFQAIVNMGVAVNIFPVTGQTLPLVSMGGTSMLFSSISMGIILSISRTLQLNEEEKLEMIALNEEENENNN